MGRGEIMSNEVKETSLQITGMTCAACANRIEKGLNKIDGVEEANVNLALEKSVIKYNPEKVSQQEFEKKIEALGYGVVKDKKEFAITGMTCAAWANRIEKGLNKMEGVTLANVNLALEHATVEYYPSQVSVADIVGRVEKLGYLAHLKENEQDTVDFREKAIQKQKQKFIISAILSLPLLWTMVCHFSLISQCFKSTYIKLPPYNKLYWCC